MVILAKINVPRTVHGCKLDLLNQYLKCDIEILSEIWGKCNHFSELENCQFRYQKYKQIQNEV